MCLRLVSDMWMHDMRMCVVLFIHLAAPVMNLLGDHGWEDSILTFVPNTSEIALHGISTEINKLIWKSSSQGLLKAQQAAGIPVEKLIFKDAKLRTFIFMVQVFLLLLVDVMETHPLDVISVGTNMGWIWIVASTTFTSCMKAQAFVVINLKSTHTTTSLKNFSSHD